jgi:hypothetical protein
MRSRRSPVFHLRARRLRAATGLRWCATPRVGSRYSALVEDPEGAATPRLGIAWLQALNRRDREAARACLHDDLLLIDHRRVSTFAPQTDVERYLDQMFGAVAVADDLRWWLNDRVEVRSGLVGRAEMLMGGHLNDGGGWAEIRIDNVYSRRGDRFERIENYPPGTLAEQQARIAELEAQLREAERR